MDSICFYPSILGEIVIRNDGSSLTGLYFADQRHLPEGVLDLPKEENAVTEKTKQWLDLYFSGKNPDFTPPLQLNGTPFQKEVWKILQTIPYGQTRSYKQIAEMFAAEKGILRMSAQAVGSAIGRNPISIIVPCHRVIGSDGALTGYAGGTERKEKLLQQESPSVKTKKKRIE